MSKEYMIGTLADTPLLKVTVGEAVFFVDEAKKRVFMDDKGLTRVKDPEIIEGVLEAAK